MSSATCWASPTPVSPTRRPPIFDIVVDNDVRFYSIGFGTDVDDEILSAVALDSGGVHVNEQDLDALSLSKLFLAIGAGAVDDALLIDPRVSVGRNQTASLEVEVSSDERHLTVAVNWVTRSPSRVSAAILTPGGGCRIPDPGSGVGYQTRGGSSYRIMRVALPYRCLGQNVDAGTWRVEVRGGKIADGEREDVDIIVFARSGTNLLPKIGVSENRATLTARLVRQGVPLRGADVVATVRPAVPATGDSERQDALGAAWSGEVETPRPREPQRLRLYDDSTHGDRKEGDGTYARAIKITEAGLFHVHLVAQYRQAKRTLRREALTSFYVSGP